MTPTKAPAKKATAKKPARKRVDPWGGHPPLYASPVTAVEKRRGDGDKVADFIETFCKTTMESFAGPAKVPLVLDHWQRESLRRIFARRADGRLKHRTFLWGLARKNGKSTIGAGVGLDGMVFGGEGSQVFSCAADREQARIVFGTAKRMIELEDELSDMIKTQRDVLILEETNAVYRCLSAEAFTKEGLNPSRTLFDELHAQPNDELWNVMRLAMGARIDALLLAITTAGVVSDTFGNDTVCYRNYKYGVSVATGEVVDPSFGFLWFGAPPGDDPRSPKTWAKANPGYGTLIDPEDFESSVRTTPENEFRTKRLNQWVAGHTAFLPAGAWAARKVEREVEPDAPIIVAFDGSFAHDSTALLGVTIEEMPHIFVLGIWEKSQTDAPDWRVPPIEVDRTIREACKRYAVVEIVRDPKLWDQTFAQLDDAGYPIVDYPQNATRMVPATQAFYEGVIGGHLTHDGNEHLSRHIANAVLKTTERGSMLTKPKRGGQRHIDGAVTAVMGFDRAVHPTPPKPEIRIWDMDDILNDPDLLLDEDDEDLEDEGEEI